MVRWADRVEVGENARVMTALGPRPRPSVLPIWSCDFLPQLLPEVAVPRTKGREHEFEPLLA